MYDGNLKLFRCVAQAYKSLSDILKLYFRLILNHFPFQFKGNHPVSIFASFKHQHFYNLVYKYLIARIVNKIIIHIEHKPEMIIHIEHKPEIIL